MVRVVVAEDGDRLFLEDDVVKEKSVGLDPFVVKRVVVWRMEEMHVPPRNPKIMEIATCLVQKDFDGLDVFMSRLKRWRHRGCCCLQYEVLFE